jgi:hypothetical protein
MVETCPVQWYPNKQAMPADKVSSPENNYNTLCAVKDRANVKAKGSSKNMQCFPSYVNLWRSAEEAATMK